MNDVSPPLNDTSPLTATNWLSVRKRLAQVLGPAESLRGQLTRGGMGSLFVKISQVFLTFLVAVVLARTLGPAQYGVFVFVQAMVMVLAIPAQLGLPELVVRETAKAQTHEQWGMMRGLWRWSTVAVLVFSAAITVTALIGVWLFADRISGVQFATLVFGLLLVPLVALGNLRGAALRGLRHVVIGQLPESILRPGLLVVFLLSVLVVFPSGTLGPSHAMALLSLAAAFAFGVGIWLLWRARPTALADRPAPVYRTRDWIGAAIPLALITGLQIISHHVDILMLGVIRSAGEVGIYKVVVTGAALVAFGLSAVNQVVAPHFARLWAQRDTARLQRVVTQSARAILALALPTVFALVFFGDVILTLVFGSDYSSGHMALAILAVGQLVNATMGSVGALLNMTGNERDTMRGVAIAAVAKVILNLVLIPPFGIVGAAVATAITLTIWNLMLHKSVRVRLGIESMAFGPSLTSRETIA